MPMAPCSSPYRAPLHRTPTVREEVADVTVKIKVGKFQLEVSISKVVMFAILALL